MNRSGHDRPAGSFFRPRAVVFASALLMLACGGCAPSAPPFPANPADLVIVNGKVHVADEAKSVVQAVAVKGNTILKLGTTDEIKTLAGPSTRVIDANGATVTPGFTDSHVHFIQGGLALRQVDLAGLTTLDQVQSAIRAFAARQPGGAWVRGFGWLYQPFPGASPTKAQLDAVVPDRPAVMDCYDGHSIWVNSVVLKMAGIGKATKDPKNGVIVRDPKTGEPTGHLKEAARGLIAAIQPKETVADRRAALQAAIAEANRFGVTSIHNAGTSLDDMAVYDEAKKAGTLTVRSYLATRAVAGITEADVDRMDAARRQYGDDSLLRTGIVKIFADGVIEAKTAAMLEPYVGTKSAGEPNLTAAELNRIVAMFDARGWQIQIHAIGDRAIRMSLDAFEAAARSNPAPARGRRHRLEHIEAVSAADIARFGQLGVIASQQPMHVALGDANQSVPKGPWPDAIGPERASRAWAWKSILRGGGRVTFGSDWPVATLKAGQGIWLASTRVRADGAEDQRLSIDDALAGYTRWAAYASFDEKRRGTLQPGMLADIVVLTTDITAAPIPEKNDVVVAITIFDGKVVYERRQLPHRRTDTSKREPAP
jgi:predicted amidohydrolase YtcJ